MAVKERATGATAVGALTDLPALGQLAVLCLRGLGRRDADLRDRLARSFGTAQADAIIARCDDLAQFLARFARRPLVRHSPDCPCLGADEAAFAHACRLASDGERDEVLMVAMILCRADMAPCLVPLAEAFAMTLKRGIACAGAPMGCPVHTPSTLH